MLSLPLVPVIVVPEMVTPELTEQLTIGGRAVATVELDGCTSSAQAAAASARIKGMARPYG